MQLPPTQHPERGRKTARGVRQNTPPPGAELPALAGGAGAPAAVAPASEPEPAPQAPTPERLRSRNPKQASPKGPNRPQERVKTPPPPIEQPQQISAPAVSASTEALDTEWSQLAERTMDHEYASRSIDQREVVRKIQGTLSSGGLGESTMVLLLEVVVNLGRACSPEQQPALERIPPLMMESLRQNLDAGNTGLVLAALEALAVLPDITWEFVELMPAVLGYRHDASLSVQTAACACYEAFFQANPGLRVRAQLAELRPPRLPALAACLQPLRLAQHLGHSLAAAVPPDWSARLAPAASACLASIVVPLSALSVQDASVYPSPTGRGEHGDAEAREEALLSYGLTATVAEALTSQDAAVQALCAVIASHRGASTREEMVATQALTVLLRTSSSIGSTAPSLVQDGALWELTLQLILSEGPEGNVTVAATLLLTELLATVPSAADGGRLPLPAAAFGVGALLQRLATAGEDVVLLSATAGLLGQLLAHGVNSSAICHACLQQPDTLTALRRVLSANAEEVSLQNWVGGPLGTSELLLLGARAGVGDGAVSLMLRCATAEPPLPLDALMSEGLWAELCRNLRDLAEGGARCPLSIMGSRDALQLAHQVLCRDNARFLPMLVQHDLLQTLVALLHEPSVVCLQNWPAELGGGPDALCLLVDLAAQCVFLPFSQPGPVDEELLQLVQRVLLGPGQLVGKLVGVLRLMVASNRETNDAYELPTRLLSRLILGHEAFGSQFVEAGGLRDGVVPRLLGNENPPGLLIDALLLVSQLARSKKEHYAHVDGADIYPQVRPAMICRFVIILLSGFPLPR